MNMTGFWKGKILVRNLSFVQRDQWWFVEAMVTREGEASWAGFKYSIENWGRMVVELSIVGENGKEKGNRIETFRIIIVEWKFERWLL